MSVKRLASSSKNTRLHCSKERDLVHGLIDLLIKARNLHLEDEQQDEEEHGFNDVAQAHRVFPDLELEEMRFLMIQVALRVETGYNLCILLIF